VRTADAPDVAQIAAISAWRSWESCALPVEQRAPWLFAIVVHAAWHFQRSAAGRGMELRDPREIDHEADPGPLPGEALEVRESVATLGELAAGTTAERWRVFVAYEIEGVPMGVIAKREIVPLGTAHNRLRLARRDVMAVVQRHRAKLAHDDERGEDAKRRPTK
jgi:DNA-directed RNA polymerase specialized sigma24 family protein